MNRILTYCGAALAAGVGILILGLPLSSALAQRPRRRRPPKGRGWTRTLSPDQRADLVMAQMTLDEKITLVHGTGGFAAPGARSNGGAGVIAGIPRLGLPDLQLADSAVGVRAAAGRGRYSTLLPSTIAEAASWDPKLAYRVRRSHRPRIARSAVQRLARRRRGHHARAAQRPQFRVPGRGSDSRRQDGRRSSSRACRTNRSSAT